jgi:hypothetical protein
VSERKLPIFKKEPLRNRNHHFFGAFRRPVLLL